MAVPAAITDALESILEIYFSAVRHRERAAFILCDNLVEMACKTRAKQLNHQFDMSCNFYNAWNAPGVELDPNGLGRRVHDHRDTRNNMQHASAAATVDAGYCATAISDVAEVIQTLWPGAALPPRINCSLRVIHLYCSGSDLTVQQKFEGAMRSQRWRAKDRESVQTHEVKVEPGTRDFWWWAIRQRLSTIESILNQVEPNEDSHA